MRWMRRRQGGFGRGGIAEPEWGVSETPVADSRNANLAALADLFWSGGIDPGCELADRPPSRHVVQPSRPVAEAGVIPSGPSN